MNRKNKLSSTVKNNKKSKLLPKIRGECCICFNETDNVILNKNNQIMKLNEINENENLDDETIFSGPCGIHLYCTNCLKNISTSFDNHPIGAEHSLVPCQPPMDGGECLSLSGLPNYFTHSDIKKILTKDEFQQYMNHADRYQFPGFELVKCPRPLYRDNVYETCNAGILVPIEHIKTQNRGHLIIYCDQNEDCNRKSCYHCYNLISRHSRVCQYCITVTEANDPKAQNRYFYRPDKRRKDGNPITYRNEELTIDLIISQLEEIATSDKAYVRCFECLVPMFKTEQCNTMTHCGIERCYCCGRSGTLRQDLGDHWDTTGIHGCPRFDHSRYWNEFANCKFLCQENECYNDEIGECNILSHQPGIHNMNQERKRCQIYHAIRSLLPELRDEVLKQMYINKNLRQFIPQHLSSDHRTCNADTLQKFFTKNTNIEDRDVYLDLFKKLEFEKPDIKHSKPQPKKESIIKDLYKRYILRA